MFGQIHTKVDSNQTKVILTMNVINNRSLSQAEHIYSVIN